MSASVQTVETRATVAPASCALSRSALRADAGEDRDRDLRPLGDGRGRRREQLGVGVQRPAVLDRARAQSVAVPDGDRPHARAIERARDGLDLLDAVLVRDRVRAVAQRRVDDPHGRPACSRRSLGVQLRDAHGGGGHDVEVAGIRREIVACALDLEHHRDDAVGDQRGAVRRYPGT